MSHTYSTLQRDAAGGRVYSSRQSQVSVLPAGDARRGPKVIATPVAPAAHQRAQAVLPTAAPTPTPTNLHCFTLSCQGQAAAAQIGPEATARAMLTGTGVTAELAGLKPIQDASILPTLWLIHDLPVPTDLSPQDLSALPKGTAGTGNQPGAIYTMDGNAATYTQSPNTLAIAVSPGTFAQHADGSWRLTGALDNRSNQAYHPLVVLGPSVLADMNAALPSGTVARIMTDLFMRPATVHPELDLRRQFAQRLAAVCRDVLAMGTVDFLAPERFTRAAVTLEGPVRTTSRLMPTVNTCFLMALRPD